MSQTYHLDGMVVRDQDNQYVCEVIAYDTDGLNSLLRAPEVLALVQVDRDIKAANLQLLVEKVLAIDNPQDHAAYKATDAAIELARSLKQ